MTQALAGSTAFITGASRGIGRSIALRLAGEGCNVVLAAKTSDPHPKLSGTIHSVADEVAAAGGRALAVQCDVRFEDSVQAALDQYAAAVADPNLAVDAALRRARLMSRLGRDGEARGALEDGGIRLAPAAWGPIEPNLADVQATCARIADVPLDASLLSSRRLAPVPNPPQLIGIGLNYRDHAIESGLPIPTAPIAFAFLMDSTSCFASSGRSAFSIWSFISAIVLLFRSSTLIRW
jgi:hypothetical protein